MAVTQGIQITGLDAALRGIRTTRARLLPALGRALHAEAAPVFDRSQDLVPVDTKELKKSGELHEPVIDGNSVSVELSYGNAATAEYAERIHEDLEMNHPRGGKAKFLEEPFLEGESGMGERVGARVAREIGGR